MNIAFIKSRISKSLLAIGLFFAFTLNTKAQNNNIEKYWYYRHRLVNGFVKIGNQPGESLVAGVRNIYSDDDSSQNFNIHNHKYLDYGDQTIYLGWYIGVLATEYKLLFDANKNNNKSHQIIHRKTKAD